MSSNNQLIALLKTTSQNQTLQNEIIHEEKKLARTLKDTLFLLFIVLEVMSYFSLVSKILLALNTSDEVKNLATHLSKLEEIEANVYDAVVTTKTEQVTNTINQALEAVQNHPIPIYATAQNHQNQEDKAQIAFNTNSGSNGYFMGTVGNFPQNQEKPSFLPIINKRNPTSSGTRTETNPNKEDNLKENLNNEEKEVLDLMKFDHKENELIKILWENGTVKAGDKLLSKRFVLPQLPRTITERDLINLYEKLIDYHMVEFKNGYRALVDAENVVMSKSENRG